MRKLISIFSLVLLYVTIAYGQAFIDIPFSGTDGTSTIPLAIGLDLTATDCIDPALGESDLPPFPPPGVFDIRFDLSPACPALSTAKDYRPVPAFPFTGTKQHTLWWQVSAPGAVPINLTYNLPTGASMTIVDNITGTLLNLGPFTGSGVAVIPATYTAFGTKAFVNVTYTNIGGTLAPVFTIAPANLAFGNVEVGASTMLQTTVTNTGSAALVISNIVSSDAQFTFTPNTFPITIVPGANQVFDVTFAPAAIGSYNADLTFTHNATPPTNVYALTGNGVAPGLVDLENTFSGSDGTSTILLATGLDATATDCIDPALGESDLPPFPPPGVFDIRFDLSPACPALSSLKDYRFAADPLNFTGTIQHTLWWQVSAAGVPIELQYNLHPNATMTIVDNITGTLLNLGPFTGSGTAIIPGSYTAFGTKAFMRIAYVPPSGGPIFGVNPASLNFGNVYLSQFSNLPATVSNTGTANLVISGVTSSNAQFTFLPNSFPVTIIPGGSQIFNVTFTPTLQGPTSANLVFTHNAPGSPTSYSVQGTGLVIEPDVPDSLNIIVNTGGTFIDTIIVTNNSNIPLDVTGTITELPLLPANWFISPTTPVNIPAGQSRPFILSFIAPALPGTYLATLTFSAPGVENTVIDLSGVVVLESGLIFENEIVYRIEDNSYMDKMKLIATAFPVHAIQFRLYTNQDTTGVDDRVILSFLSIQKGLDVADPNWVLDYNVIRGPITGNGASKDIVYVLLYNTTNVSLPPGNYNDLLHVNYRVANLPGLQDSVKSSIVIKNAEGSTFEGFDVDITPSRDELQVIALNTKSGFGDVNGDGCIDILDLILVVDHIVGRDSLSASEFARADIAPWVTGNELPDPDGFVNVQDLSLIQNIILTGFYPDGTPVAPCQFAILPKGDGDADATIDVYISNEGITVYLDSKIGIRGAQMEFNNVADDASNLVINTDLGQGYSLQVNEILRTLMYDRLAVKYIEQGKHFMADMPFGITTPENVTLDKLILVDINTQRVMKIEVNIIYEQAPVPLDYILFQNYPNPFNPSTSVKFQVPKTSDVTIKVYDMLGQEVRTLFTGEVLRGNYTVEWDGLNDAGQQMSSGSYIYRMIAGEFMQAKKMVYVK